VDSHTIFLPSFAEIDKVEVTKRERGIHQEKEVGILPLYSVASGAISQKIL